MKSIPLSGSMTTLITCLLLLPAFSTHTHAQDMSEAIAEAAGVPQIPAFLPDRYSIARTEPLPIDGLWMVSTIRKKIRIEQGRAYAVDPWLHLFVLKVQPDMVVLQNFQRTGAGQYKADDLPLLGPATMTLNGEGNLDVSVQGKLGPARYGLVRLEPQYPEALSHEVEAATGQALPAQTARPAGGAPLPGMPTGSAPPPQSQPYTPSPTPTPAPTPAPAPAPPSGEAPENCTPIGVDPDTGQTICAY